MDFALTEEQQMIVKSTRDFVEHELYPHEQEIEQSGELRPELLRELKAKAIEAGLYAANMPTEVGGAGLDAVTWILYEKELGRASYALHYSCVARPSNILLACEGEQLAASTASTHGCCSPRTDAASNGRRSVRPAPMTRRRRHATATTRRGCAERSHVRTLNRVVEPDSGSADPTAHTPVVSSEVRNSPKTA